MGMEDFSSILKSIDIRNTEIIILSILLWSQNDGQHHSSREAGLVIAKFLNRHQYTVSNMIFWGGLTQLAIYAA